MIKLKDLLPEIENSITDQFSSEIQTLQKYVKPGGERDTDIDNAIQTLFNNKSKYPKELNPKAGEVYRGTIENKEELKSMKPIKKDGRWFYYKKEYKSKTGETPVKKDMHADAIGAILRLPENDIESLTKANKNALKVIFEALANSKPI
jgi:hypothetical protein